MVENAIPTHLACQKCDGRGAQGTSRCQDCDGSGITPGAGSKDARLVASATFGLIAEYRAARYADMGVQLDAVKAGLIDALNQPIATPPR